MRGSAIIQAVNLRRKMRFERQDDKLKVGMLTEMSVDQVDRNGQQACGYISVKSYRSRLDKCSHEINLEVLSI